MDHKTTVNFSRKEGWFGVCTCGWTSRKHLPDEHVAKNLSEAHKQTQRRKGNGRS